MRYHNQSLAKSMIAIQQVFVLGLGLAVILTHDKAIAGDVTPVEPIQFELELQKDSGTDEDSEQWDKSNKTGSQNLPEQELPAAQKDKLPAVQKRKLPNARKDNLPTEQKDKLPAVQKNRLPTVQQDQLPAVQKDKLPAVQKPDSPGIEVSSPDSRATLDGEIPAGGGFADQDTVDALKSGTRHDIQRHHTPGTGFLPLPDQDETGDPSACDPSERGPGWAQECLRERTPDIRITGIGNYDDSRGCDADWETIELHGSGFGNEQGTRRALLTRTASDRRGPDTVAELEVIEWRDDRVHFDVPTHRVRRGVNYYVGIWSADGELLAPPASLQFCNRYATVSGTIKVRNCAANRDDVSMTITAGDNTYMPHIDIDPGNDFQWRYKQRIPLNEERTITETTVTPKMRPGVCAGEWEPAAANLRLSHLVSAKEQNFDYDVGQQEFRTSVSALLSLLDSAFRGMEVRLNNYYGTRSDGEYEYGDGSSYKGTWHKPWDSHLTLPDGLGGHSERFNIPEQRQGRRRFYVRDINLQDISVDTAGGAFELEFRFESGGKSEIKGHCLVARSIGDGFRDCIVGSDKGAPDGQINHMVWRIQLTPARYLGDLAYSDVDVEVEADVQAGGVCSRAGGAGISHTAGSPAPIPVDMCDIVWDYKDQIRNQARDTLRAILQRDDTRRQIADGLRPTLDSFGIGEIREVRLEGGELIISHLPLPDDSS